MPSNCLIQTQARLDELHSYGFQRQPVGATRALTANVNQSVVGTRMLEADGKIKKYQITYMEPDCSEPPACGDVDRCDAGTKKTVQSEYKTIDKCAASGVIELTDQDYRDLCNFGPNQFTMNQILGKFDMMARSINAQILTSLAAGIGDFGPGQADPKDIALINPQTQAPVWGADVDIITDFADAGMTVTPILIGGRTLLKYDKGVNAGGNSQNGVNMGQMDRFPMFYDNQIQSIANTTQGRETIFAIAPQLVHVVNYLENVGDFQSNLDFNNTDPLSFMRQGETYNYGLVQDPFTGWMYDMDVIFDACAKKWKLSFRSYYDIWIMRLTQCYHAGFTGLLQYNVCNPAPVNCG